MSDLRAVASETCDVLIVEDEREIAELVALILADRGHRVAVASDGAVALELLLSAVAPPRLMLLDVNMPVLDGRTLLLELARRRPALDLPIILTTAGLDHTVPPGVRRLLAKPYSIDALLDAVAEEIAPAGSRTRATIARPPHPALGAMVGPATGA